LEVLLCHGGGPLDQAEKENVAESESHNAIEEFAANTHFGIASLIQSIAGGEPSHS
jgi:hypothetical protein